MHDRTSRDCLKGLLGEIRTSNVFQVRAHTEKRRATCRERLYQLTKCIYHHEKYVSRNVNVKGEIADGN